MLQRIQQIGRLNFSFHDDDGEDNNGADDICQQVRRNTVFKTTGLEDWVVEGGPRGQCFVKEDIRRPCEGRPIIVNAK